MPLPKAQERGTEALICREGLAHWPSRRPSGRVGARQGGAKPAETGAMYSSKAQSLKHTWSWPGDQNKRMQNIIRVCWKNKNMKDAQGVDD